MTLLLIVLAALAQTTDWIEQPVIPNASVTLIDTTPPEVTVQPSAWAWPYCTEPGVERQFVGRNGGGNSWPAWRRGVWTFTDPAMNQTIVVRTEMTWVYRMVHKTPADEPVPEGAP